jgi:hypothetical protein
VKLAGRNEILETFWKSVGPAVWTYTEIPKGQRYKLLMRLKIIKKSQSIPVWQWVISCLINVDFPLPNSAEKIYSLTISHEKDIFKIILTYYLYYIWLNGSISLRVLHCILCSEIIGGYTSRFFH